MNPRSLTPLCRIPRSSSRSTAWWKVACETENAMWCTQPGSVAVRAGSGVRSSLVKIVIRRPSPGSKYRWLSDSLSRFGCSNTKGMPSTPSQKSIEVCRSAPTIVMWCTPWLWSFLISLLGSMLDQFRLVVAAPQAAPRHEVHARLDGQYAAQCLADRFGQGGIGGHPARQLHAHGQGRLLLHALGARPDQDVAAHLGSERTHNLADGGGEHVHAAHDQHVVGAPHAPDPRAGAAAGTGARADLHVVARAEAEQRRCAVAQVGQDELAAGGVVHRERLARGRVDQLGVDEAARAEMHPVLLLALAPERYPDVADPHRLGHQRAPALLELRPEGRLAAARLARHQHPFDARAADVEALSHVGGVRRRERRGL